MKGSAVYNAVSDYSYNWVFLIRAYHQSSAEDAEHGWGYSFHPITVFCTKTQV